MKTVSPKAGSLVSAQDLELKWDAYPDAAYYTFSLHPDNHQVEAPYVNERVEALRSKSRSRWRRAVYRFKVEAYNSADKKLSETADDIKFSIN